MIIILIIALVFLVIGLYWTFIGLFDIIRQFRINRQIKSGVVVRDKFAEEDGLLKAIKASSVELGGVLSRLKVGFIQKDREIIEDKLRMAGLSEKYNANIIMGYQVLCAVTVAVVSLFVFGVNLVFLLLAVCCGLWGPIIWLDGQIKKRQIAIFRQLPDCLDILTLLVEAGLDFGAAFNKLIEHEKGPLIDEFFKAQQEIKLGKNRLTALSNMARSVQNKYLTSVISSIVQSMQSGASIGPTLRTLSDDFRIQRAQMAEELGAKAPVKMLFPMLFFIFPTLFMLIFLPIILRFLFGGKML